MKELFLSIAERLMRCPASPYHEQLVQQEVEHICREHQLEHSQDEFGNILVQVITDANLRPVVFAAHMDHPGFVISPAVPGGGLQGLFLGGVGDAWFKPGTSLLLMPGRVRATLGPRLNEKREFQITPEVPMGDQHPRFAVWDLPEFVFENDTITGRVCDDLVGVAAALTALIALRQSSKPLHAIAALTRAEEVGFHGALALSRNGRLPKNSFVISLETSRELPPTQMGQGVILRVGDRASVFNPEGMRFLLEVATELQKENGSFRFQRALMSGGTCEGTAYQEEGYQTSGLCVALGNYHNCGAGERIAAEYVSLQDSLGMCQFLVETALAMPHFEAYTQRLPQRLHGYYLEAVAALHPLR